MHMRLKPLFFAPFVLIGLVSGCSDDGSDPGGRDASTASDSMVVGGDAARDAGFVFPAVDGSVDAGLADAGAIDAGERADAGRDSGYDADRDAGTDAGHDAGPPRCGDDRINGTEECDDGNEVSFDGCSSTCEDEGSCADAIDLNAHGTVGTGGTLSIIGSTEDGLDHIHDAECSDFGVAANDIVYLYVPPTAGQLYVTTESSTTAFDTLIYARTTCGDVESELACDDDLPDGVASGMGFEVVAGTPIFLVVDGYDAGERGLFELSVKLTPFIALGGSCDPESTEEGICGPGTLCVADGEGGFECDDADLGCGPGVDVVDLTPMISGDEVIYSGTTASHYSSANGSCGDGSGEATSAGGEVFHKITLPYAAELEAYVDADFDSVLYARSDCPDAESELECGYYGLYFGDGVSGLAGESIYVAVDGTFPSDVGPYELTINLRAIAVEGEPCSSDSEGPNCARGLSCREVTFGEGVCVVPVCGDGMVEGPEACDSPSTPEACDPTTCTLIDQGIGGERCDTLRTLILATTGPESKEAFATGTTVGAGDDFAGEDGGGFFSCDVAAASPDVIYAFTLFEPSDVFISADLPRGSEYDLTLYMRGADGPACMDVGAELDCSESGGAGEGEFLSAYDLEPGTYYVIVDGYTNMVSGPSSGEYELSVTAYPIL